VKQQGIKEDHLRILGIDYGSRRIGVAVCDELGITAQGVTTINRKNRESDIEAIAKLVSCYNIEKIVIGYPLRLDGSEGIQCEKVNRFSRRLEIRVSLSVVRWDETLSTMRAEEILRETGVPLAKRRAVVDRIAAAIILQDYLDTLRKREIEEITLRSAEYD
jgi:putative Holliday junction resolvase